MFPHSPDNTFLGFVVEEVNSSLSRTPEQEERRNISLVYGKDRTMWEGKENLVRVRFWILLIVMLLPKEGKNGSLCAICALVSVCVL